MRLNRRFSRSAPRVAACLAPAFLSLFLSAAPLAAQTYGPSGDVPYVPTPPEVVEAMLKLGEVKNGDVLYDLGCGDGRIVIAAAKKAGARAFGFDIDPQMVELSRLNIKNEGVGHLVTVEERDIFQLDLSGASVITLYLLPELNVRLIPQLEKLKPGTRIVSHAFDMKGVQPDVAAEVYTSQGIPFQVFLWTTPLRKK